MIAAANLSQYRPTPADVRRDRERMHGHANHRLPLLRYLAAKLHSADASSSATCAFQSALSYRRPHPRGGSGVMAASLALPFHR
jgi:hypothetical protein